MGWSISPKTKASINEENGKAVFQENESQNDSAYTITYSDCYQTGSTTITVKHCQQCASAFTCYRADSIGDTGATYDITNVSDGNIYGKTQEYIITGTSKDCSGNYKAPIVTISDDSEDFRWVVAITNTGTNYTIRIYYDDVYKSPYLKSYDPYEDNNTRATITVKNPMSNTECGTFEVYFNKLKATLDVSYKRFEKWFDEPTGTQTDSYLYKVRLQVLRSGGHEFEVPFKDNLNIIINIKYVLVKRISSHPEIPTLTFSSAPFTNCQCTYPNRVVSGITPTITVSPTDTVGERYFTAYGFVGEYPNVERVDLNTCTPAKLDCVIPGTTDTHDSCADVEGISYFNAAPQYGNTSITDSRGHPLCHLDEHNVESDYFIIFKDAAIVPEDD